MPYPSADPGGAIIMLIALFVLAFFVELDEPKNKKGK